MLVKVNLGSLVNWILNALSQKNRLKEEKRKTFIKRMQVKDPAVFHWTQGQAVHSDLLSAENWDAEIHQGSKLSHHQSLSLSLPLEPHDLSSLQQSVGLLHSSLCRLAFSTHQYTNTALQFTSSWFPTQMEIYKITECQL